MRLESERIPGVLGEGGRMISAWWLLPAFVVGGMIGFFAAALFAASKDN